MSDLVASNSSSPNDNVGLVSLTEWLNYMQQIHVSAIDMGLSRVLPVAEALGVVKSAKDDAYVFTVAGTNGKGSTTPPKRYVACVFAKNKRCGCCGLVRAFCCACRVCALCVWVVCGVCYVHCAVLPALLAPNLRVLCRFVRFAGSWPWVA